MEADRETRPETAIHATGFVPVDGIEGVDYRPLHCACGGRVFRVSGSPRVAAGSGGFFWRSVTRVWREARELAGEGEPHASAFPLPIETECDACGRRALLPEEGASRSGAPPAGSGRPREAYRCRDCRRGRVELATGLAPVAPDGASQVVDVVARCVRCRREAHLAASDECPTDQQRRLDLLYGRR